MWNIIFVFETREKVTWTHTNTKKRSNRIHSKTKKRSTRIWWNKNKKKFECNKKLCEQKKKSTTNTSFSPHSHPSWIFNSLYCLIYLFVWFFFRVQLREILTFWFNHNQKPFDCFNHSRIRFMWAININAKIKQKWNANYVFQTHINTYPGMHLLWWMIRCYWSRLTW